MHQKPPKNQPLETAASTRHNNTPTSPCMLSVKCSFWRAVTWWIHTFDGRGSVNVSRKDSFVPAKRFGGLLLGKPMMKKIVSREVSPLRVTDQWYITWFIKSESLTSESNLCSLYEEVPTSLWSSGDSGLWLDKGTGSHVLQEIMDCVNTGFGVPRNDCQWV